jgi:hypothetical protein
MGIESKEERAVNAAGAPWRALPATVQRQAQIAGILAHEGVTWGAEGMTRALQVAIALDQVNPIPDVVQWMQAEKMWPFDGNK